MEEIKKLLEQQIEQLKIQNQLITGGFLFLAKALDPIRRAGALRQEDRLEDLCHNEILYLGTRGKH